MNESSRQRLHRNFHIVLSISDDGLNMMLQRVRRQNPKQDERQICILLRKELAEYGRSSLPSYLVPVQRQKGI